MAKKEESAQRKWLRFEGRLLLFFCFVGVIAVYLCEAYFGHGQLMPLNLFINSMSFKTLNNIFSSPILNPDKNYHICRTLLNFGQKKFNFKLHDSVTYEDFAVPVSKPTNGTMNLRLFFLKNQAKTETKPRMIYYVHGGGYATGELSQYSDLFSDLAMQGFVVAAPQYRKAPEHKFPTALEDSIEGLVWARKNLADRFDVNKVIVSGDSAGGNLAAILPFELREQNLPQVQYQVLIYPRTMSPEAMKETESYKKFKKTAYFIDGRQLENFGRMYNPNHYRGPRLSPYDNTDFTGVPPALIVTVDNDILRSQGELYAQKLTANNIPNEVYEVKGELHIFIQAKVHTVSLETRAKVMQKIFESIDKNVPAQ